MKTRIISGIILGIAFAGIVLLGLFVSPFFVTALAVFLAVTATYELLKNALGVKVKAAIIGACIAAALMVVFNDTALDSVISAAISGGIKSGVLFVVVNIYYAIKGAVFMLYFFFAATVILACHEQFDLAQGFAFIAAPRILTFGFTRMAAIIRGYRATGTKLGTKDSLYYLFILLAVSCVCDMGAYFIGVKWGKHKLSPVVSPKKTVEGALGGIICAVVAVIILMAVFSKTNRVWPTILFTVPLCILGMLGDLFASVIKRKSGIKDYGNLIPGHGGVLDRFDSTLFIAPFLYMLILYGVI